MKYIKMFADATPETKNFFFNAALYLIIILGGAAFAYIRLDTVRSFDKDQGRYKQERSS